MIENVFGRLLHLAFRHFGTRETLGCSRVDMSRVQKVKLPYVIRAESLPVQEKLH